MTGRTVGPRSRGLRRCALLLGVVSIVLLASAGGVLAAAPTSVSADEQQASLSAAFALPSDVDQTLLDRYGLTHAQLLQISDGYEDGFWRPYTAVTRAEYAKFVVKAFGLAPVNPVTATFTDVPETHPLYGYVEAAAAAGMIRGRLEGLFAPDSTITRQEAAAIVVRYLVKKSGRDLSVLMPDELVAAQLSRFADDLEVSPSLEREVATAVARVALRGTSTDGISCLNPTAPVTRIQAAALSLRQEKPGLSTLVVGEGGGFISEIFHWAGEMIANGGICFGLEKAWSALVGDDHWDEVSDDLKNIQSSIDEANKSVVEIQNQIASLKQEFLSEVNSTIAESDALKAEDAMEAIDDWYSSLGATNYRYYVSLYQNPPTNALSKADDLTDFMDDARRPGGDLDLGVKNIHGAIFPSSSLVTGVFTAWVDTICAGALSEDEVMAAYLSMEGYMCQLVLHQMEAVQIQCDALNARDERDGIAKKDGMAHYPSATKYLNDWYTMLQAETDEFLTEVTHLVLHYAKDLNNFTPDVLDDATLSAILSRADFVCCSLEEQHDVFADGSGTGDPQTAYGMQSLLLYPTSLVTHNEDVYAQAGGAAAIAGTVDKTLSIEGPATGLFDTTVSPATLNLSNAWTLKRIRYSGSEAHPGASFVQRHFAPDVATYQHCTVPLVYTSADYTQSSTSVDGAVLYGCGVISYQHFSGTSAAPDAMWYRPAPMGQGASGWSMIYATCWLNSSPAHPRQPAPTQTPGHSVVSDTYTRSLRWQQMAGLPYFTFVGPTGTKLGFRAYTASPGQTLATWTCNRPSKEMTFNGLYLGLQQGIITPTTPPTLLAQSNMTANTDVSPSATASVTLTNGGQYCFTQFHDIAWDSPGVPTKGYDLSMTLDTHFDHVGLVFGE